jgi:hypothetical protein
LALINPHDPFRQPKRVDDLFAKQIDERLAFVHRMASRRSPLPSFEWVWRRFKRIALPARCRSHPTRSARKYLIRALGTLVQQGFS